MSVFTTVVVIIMMVMMAMTHAAQQPLASCLVTDFSTGVTYDFSALATANATILSTNATLFPLSSEAAISFCGNQQQLGSNCSSSSNHEASLLTPVLLFTGHANAPAMCASGGALSLRQWGVPSQGGLLNLVLRGGSRTLSCPNGLQTTIEFSCSTTVQPSSSTPLSLFQTSDCTFLLPYPTQLACPAPPPRVMAAFPASLVPPPPSPNAPPSPNSSPPPYAASTLAVIGGAAGVVIVVLFVLLACRQNRRGWDQQGGGREGLMGGEAEEDQVDVATLPKRLRRMNDHFFRRLSVTVRQSISSQRPSEDKAPAGVEMRASVAARTSAGSCIVCFDNPPEVVFMHCGHGGMCEECGRSLFAMPKNRRRCPVCRSIIVAVMRLHMDDLRGSQVAVTPIAPAPPPGSAAAAAAEHSRPASRGVSRGGGGGGGGDSGGGGEARFEAAAARAALRGSVGGAAAAAGATGAGRQAAVPEEADEEAGGDGRREP